MAAVAILLVIGAAGLWWLLDGRPPPASPPGHAAWSGPVPVRTAAATAEPLQVWLRALGTVTPQRTVVVRSRVDGELIELGFEDGQRVEAGALLARIDPRPFEVALARAEGEQQQRVAQLRNAEADLARYQALSQQQQVAQQLLESQAALVSQHRGLVRAGQAQVDEARLQLSYTRITAPIAGRVGLRRVDVGNLLRAGDSEGIVVITQMQPMSVLFTIPESRLDELLASEAGGEGLTVEAWDRGDRQRLAVGHLRAIDNQIDASTGTLRLRAEFANEDERLFPNQFVNVRLHVRDEAGVVTIPLDAVQHGDRGPYVFVAGDDGRAQQRQLTLGTSAEGRVAVQAGLAVGERVVIEGVDRLRDGRELQRVDAAADAPG